MILRLLKRLFRVTVMLAMIVIISAALLVMLAVLMPHRTVPYVLRHGIAGLELQVGAVWLRRDGVTLSAASFDWNGRVTGRCAQCAVSILSIRPLRLGLLVHDGDVTVCSGARQPAATEAVQPSQQRSATPVAIDAELRRIRIRLSDPAYQGFEALVDAVGSYTPASDVPLTAVVSVDALAPHTLQCTFAATQSTTRLTMDGVWQTEDIAAIARRAQLPISVSNGVAAGDVDFSMDGLTSEVRRLNMSAQTHLGASSVWHPYAGTASAMQAWLRFTFRDATLARSEPAIPLTSLVERISCALTARAHQVDLPGFSGRDVELLAVAGTGLVARGTLKAACLGGRADLTLDGAVTRGTLVKPEGVALRADLALTNIALSHVYTTFHVADTGNWARADISGTVAGNADLLLTGSVVSLSRPVLEATLSAPKLDMAGDLTSSDDHMHGETDRKLPFLRWAEDVRVAVRSTGAAVLLGGGQAPGPVGTILRGFTTSLTASAARAETPRLISHDIVLAAELRTGRLAVTRCAARTLGGDVALTAGAAPRWSPQAWPQAIDVACVLRMTNISLAALTAVAGMEGRPPQGRLSLQSQASVRASRTDEQYELADGVWEFSAHAPQVKLAEPDAKIASMLVRGTLAQRRPWQLPTAFPDLQMYALTRVTGVVHVGAAQASMGDIDMDGIDLRMESASNSLYAVVRDVELFGGSLDARGDLTRRKVKGRSLWRYLYDLDAEIRDLNAAVVCDAFKLKRNRITGRFSGVLRTSGADLATRTLRGELHSDEPGLLFAADAEKVAVEFSSDAINRQVVNQMLARLERFRYDTCRIDLDYAPVENMTTVTLTVSNELDRISFPLHYSGTWVDAIIRNLEYR